MEAGGFVGTLNVIAGVSGGSISELSKERSGDDDMSCGVGCFNAARPLLGLASCDEERILAISSSARPRLNRGAARSASKVPSPLGRVTDESREEK